MATCISECTSVTTVTYVYPPSRVTELLLQRSDLITSRSTVISYVKSAVAEQIQVRWAASDSVSPTFSMGAAPVISMPPIGPGIYLSVGIPGVLIIMAFLFFFIHLRRARKQAAAELSRRDIEMVDKAELGGEPVLPQESGGIMLVELDTIVGGPGRTAELEGPIAELAAPFPEMEGSTAAGAPQVAGPLPTEASVRLSANIIADEAGGLQRGNMSAGEWRGATHGMA